MVSPKINHPQLTISIIFDYMKLYLSICISIIYIYIIQYVYYIIYINPLGVHFKSYMRILRICTQVTACRPSAVQLSGAVDGVGGAVAWDGASAATAGGLRDAVASNSGRSPKNG